MVPFGSSVTGCGEAHSDIDVALWFRPQRSNTKALPPSDAWRRGGETPGSPGKAWEFGTEPAVDSWQWWCIAGYSLAGVELVVYSWCIAGGEL